MKYPCIESTVEFELGDAKIRLWINETEVESEYPNTRIQREASSFVFENKPTTKELIEYFVKSVPRLNAVQFIDKKSGHGIVVYTVDFENHG